jgi:hypothetical protein
MTTFLWMLYLAFTLLLTLWTLTDNIKSFIRELSLSEKKTMLFQDIGTVFMWSIWYFYFLH